MGYTPKKPRPGKPGKKNRRRRGISRALADVKPEERAQQAEAIVAESLVPWPDKLPPRRAAFCYEYLVDFNATKAAERAGYSPHSAYSIGHDLLKNHDVKEFISALKDARAAATTVHADEILNEARLMALSTLGEIYDFSTPGKRTLEMRPLDQIPERAVRAIKSIKVKHYTDAAERPYEVIEMRMHDKGGQIGNMLRHLGLYAPEEHRHRFPGGAVPTTLTLEQKAKRLLDIFQQAGNMKTQPKKKVARGE